MTESDRKPLIQWMAGLLGGLGLITLALGSGAFGFAGALIATAFTGLFLTAYQASSSQTFPKSCS